MHYRYTFPTGEPAILDIHARSERLGPDLMSYLKALQGFCISMEDSVEAMRESYSVNHQQDLFRITQYLKTLSETVGARDLEERCLRLERALLQNQSKDVPLYLADIDAAFLALKRIIRDKAPHA